MTQNLKPNNGKLYIPEKLLLRTLQNEAYRKVIGEDKQGNQFVMMRLKPGEQTDFEIHPNTDQVFYIVEGKCELQFNDHKIGREIHRNFGVQSAFIIKQKTLHNIKNVGNIDLKLITKYIGEQLHKPSIVELTKPEK